VGDAGFEPATPFLQGINMGLPGVARCSRARLPKGISLLAVAARCRMLRRRWRQRGVRSATFGAPFPTPYSPLFAWVVVNCCQEPDRNYRPPHLKAVRCFILPILNVLQPG
jgi:hypothetical protein